MGLDDDDLLFNYAMLMTEVHALKSARRAALLATPIPDGLGRTEPNERGRTYRTRHAQRLHPGEVPM